MALPAKIRQFAEAIDPTRCRVSRPKPFIFLCGGRLNNSNSSARSVRESLLQTKENRAQFSEGVAIILAETVSNSFDSRIFDDLLEMELYISSVSEAIVLILEGPGAIAELGAFSQHNELSDKLFSIVRHGRHPARSFISDGPLRQLFNRHGERAIGSYIWIDEEYNPAKKSLDDFNIRPTSLESMDRDIASFIASRPRRPIFDVKSIGGMLCLIAGLIQVCRGLKSDELTSITRILGLNVKNRFLEKSLFALSEIGWIKEEQIQHDRYWIALFSDRCIDFAYLDGKMNDTDRWLRIIADGLKSKKDNRLDLLKVDNDEEFKLDL